MITASAQHELLNGVPFIAQVEDRQSAQTHEPTTMRCTVTTHGGTTPSFVFTGDGAKLSAKLSRGHKVIHALEIQVGATAETSVVFPRDGSLLPLPGDPLWQIVQTALRKATARAAWRG